jgi:hypothetical protein
MARIYSKVSMEMWGDEKFQSLSSLKPSGQALWLYLLTGRYRTSIPGLSLNVGVGALSDRLGWPYAVVDRHWREIEAAQMAAADWKAGVVWMPKGIEHNEPESPNVIKGWGRVVLPECELVEAALDSLQAYIAARLSKAYTKAFQDTFPEVSANQEQEQEQEEDPLPPAVAGADVARRHVTRAEKRWAEEAIRSHGGCPHREPDGSDECRTSIFCIGRLVSEKRAEELRGRKAGAA